MSNRATYTPGPPDEEYDEDEYDYTDGEMLPEEQPTGLFSTPARTATVIGSLVLLVAMMSVVVWVLGSRPPETPEVALVEAPRKGALAPNFELLNVRTNQKVSLESLRGKPVFVNFWGTWCPPCRAEMPEMQRFYDAHKGEIEVVGLSNAPRDNAALVKGFVDQGLYSWTFLHDEFSEVVQRYQVMAVPSSFFIKPDGVIAAIQVGPMNSQQMEAYLQQAR